MSHEQLARSLELVMSKRAKEEEDDEEEEPEVIHADVLQKQKCW
jgi:hypothetical protein